MRRTAARVKALGEAHQVTFVIWKQRPLPGEPEEREVPFGAQDAKLGLGDVSSDGDVV